jgi:hypothetical protein
MIRTFCKSGVFLLALCPLPVLAQQSVSESAPMAANGTLDVSNVSGEVTSKAWDRPEVQVRGEIGDEQKLEFSADGEHTRIEVHAEPTGMVKTTPTSTSVRNEPVAGNVSPASRSRHDQRAELQSVSGDIDTECSGPTSRSKPSPAASRSRATTRPETCISAWSAVTHGCATSTAT